MERLVAKHWIIPFIRAIDESQFAYVPLSGRGTATALTLLCHHVLQFLDSESGAVRLLAVDFSKAFDRLPHSTIIRAAISHHLPIQTVEWISSFLTERRQRVRIDCDVSSWCRITSGVPQGSVLGPLLFCLSLSSLQPVCSNTKMIKYADDVTILHCVRDSSDDSLQLELNNVYEWSSEAGLPINDSKCVVMNMVTKRSLLLSPVKDRFSNPLPIVQDCRILGVIISSNLRWNAHIECAIKKATKRFYIIRNLRRSGCSKEIMTRVYASIIRPALLYGYPCFCNAAEYLLRSLVAVEKRALKIIHDFHSPLPPYQDAVSFANACCTKMIEKVKLYEDHPLRAIFEQREPRLRRDSSLRRPLARSKRFSRSFIKYCI